MAQKIIKIGTSVGVTIPKDILERAKIHVGDNVTLESNGTFIKIVPVKPLQHASETAQWATAYVTKHIRAFKELADK